MFVIETVFISQQSAENRFGAFLEISDNVSPSLMFLAI